MKPVTQEQVYAALNLLRLMDWTLPDAMWLVARASQFDATMESINKEMRCRTDTEIVTRAK